MKNTLKLCMGWIVGIIIAAFAMSLWRNEEIDWQRMVNLLVGGLVGVLIASGIRMYIKKAKDKANE